MGEKKISSWLLHKPWLARPLMNRRISHGTCLLLALPLEMSEKDPCSSLPHVESQSQLKAQEKRARSAREPRHSGSGTEALGVGSWCTARSAFPYRSKAQVHGPHAEMAERTRTLPEDLASLLRAEPLVSWLQLQLEEDLGKKAF